MAKRLVDIDKWKNPSFRKLPIKIKLFYMYAWENCDHAGILYFDEELISFYLGEKVNIEEIRQHLSRQVVVIDSNKIVIKDFIYVCQGDISKSKSNVAKAIITQMKKHHLYDRFMVGEFGEVKQSIAAIDPNSDKFSPI